MPTDRDLFAEEQTMVAMSFGDHIEELRARLILALLGLFVGVVVTFIPPLNLGKWVMQTMQDPAEAALKKFYEARARERAAMAEEKKEYSPPFHAEIPVEELRRAVQKVAPGIKLPPPEAIKDR